MYALKATILDDDAVSILSIPYGGPIPSPHYKKGMDLDGEFFTERTDVKADWFSERPVLWHHGRDPYMQDTLFGKAVNFRQEEDGWWSDIWFKIGEKRKSLIDMLAKKGAEIFGSSQTIPTLAKADRRTGEWLVWPHIEQTLSTSPQNTKSVMRSMKAVLSDFEKAEVNVHGGLTEMLDSLASYASDLTAKSGLTSTDLRAMERNHEDDHLTRAIAELEADIRRFALATKE